MIPMLADDSWPPADVIRMALVIAPTVVVLVYMSICANYGKILLPDLTSLFKITIIRPVVQYCPKCGSKIETPNLKEKQ
jgi:hypothetical protein